MSGIWTTHVDPVTGLQYFYNMRYQVSKWANQSDAYGQQPAPPMAANAPTSTSSPYVLGFSLPPLCSLLRIGEKVCADKSRR